ncbi:hypothetical protein Plhal703r1_c19g0085431 [Plasmopara halstedii]
MSHGEVLRTHQSGLSGSGFWGSLWKGIKSAAKGIGGFLKDNWKPITSGLLDGIATAAGPEAAPLRGLVKGVSGVGMASLMTHRRIKASGSFRLGSSFFSNPLNTLRDMIRDSPLVSAHLQYL